MARREVTGRKPGVSGGLGVKQGDSDEPPPPLLALTIRQFCDQLFPPPGHAARFRHATNIIEDIGQTGGFEIHDFWWTAQSFCQSRDCPITDCADVAQFLRQDHAWTELTQ